jgi:hypothetical protein
MNIHENFWRNNFQYEIKTVTFAFAFANDEILETGVEMEGRRQSKRKKNSYELQQNAQKWKKNRGVIYESTIDLRFNKSFETFLLRYGN